MKKKCTVVFLAMLILISVSACGTPNHSADISATQAVTSVETMPSSETETQPITEEPTQKENSLFDLILNPIFAKTEFNGIVCITYGGNVLYEKGVGTANTEKNIACTSDTIFCIGSNSKQFTATAIMLLQQEGKLSVNDTIDKYFSDYPYGNQITIHHLLSMRSGIKDYAQSAEEILQFGVSETADAKTNRQAIQKWIFSQELNFSPDEQNEYSNSNYMLLAEIIEQVSGIPYEDYIRNNIFEPLHMDSTSFLDRYDTASDNFAQPLSEAEEKTHRYKGAYFGAGDIVANVKDINKWCTAVRNHTIVSEDILTTMITNYAKDGDRLSYGYGYMTDDYGFYHTGRVWSYRSVFYWSTVKDYNLILMSNSTYGNLEELTGLVNNGLLSINP